MAMLQQCCAQCTVYIYCTFSYPHQNVHSGLNSNVRLLHLDTLLEQWDNGTAAIAFLVVKYNLPYFLN